MNEARPKTCILGRAFIGGMSICSDVVLNPNPCSFPKPIAPNGGAVGALIIHVDSFGVEVIQLHTTANHIDFSRREFTHDATLPFWPE